MFAGAGDVVEQIFDQLVVGKAVKCFGAVYGEHFDFGIQLAQQIFYRDADFYRVDFNGFNQCQRDIPERKTGGAVGQLLQARKGFL